MNYSIVLTETAQTDLSAIYRYIAVDLQSVQNANGQLSRIEKAVASLSQMPERYRVMTGKFGVKSICVLCRWIITLFSMYQHMMTLLLRLCVFCTVAEMLTDSLK